MYTLNDLLTKMGAPEIKEKGALRWHYFDKARRDIAGFAEIRLMDGGARLVAELLHTRRNHRDEDGVFHAEYQESFFLHAERRAAYFVVTKIAFDGAEYGHPDRRIVELGLSLFHSRALDISILMLEQAFNKQDMLEEKPIDPYASLKQVPRLPERPVQKETFGVVIPFRPRRQWAANL